MRLFLFVVMLTGILSACAFHAKQPVDETYYKKTQSIACSQNCS